MKLTLGFIVLLFATSTQTWDFALPTVQIPIRLEAFNTAKASQAQIPHGTHYQSAAVTSPKLETNKGDKNTTDREATDMCWKKITSQSHTADEVFLSSLRSQLTVGSWFYSAEDPMAQPDADTSLEGKFFLGLAKADLLMGRKIEKDISRAIELLNEVHEADPGNSAPLLYLAIIEKLAGRNDVALEHLRSAQRTQHFNSYLTKVSKTIMSQVKSPAEYLSAVGIVSQLPIPEYGILKEFIEVNKQPIFSLQLMQDGLNENNMSEFTDWVAVEYAVGQTTFNKLFETNEYSDYASLMKSKKEKQKVSIDKAMEILRETCDIESLWPFLQDLIGAR